jgi:hypothetical protein
MRGPAAIERLKQGRRVVAAPGNVSRPEAAEERMSAADLERGGGRIGGPPQPAIPRLRICSKIGWTWPR